MPADVLAVVASWRSSRSDFAVGWCSRRPIGTYTTKGTYSFVSAPGLRPPKIRADAPTTASELAPGYIMVANFYDLTSPPDGRPERAADPRQQPAAGVVQAGAHGRRRLATSACRPTRAKPVLAWWQGVVTSTGATESGEDVIVDQHYQTSPR